jgi:hypothetical protein
VKVVVAHNRYREAIPSGENVIVDTEIAQLTAAGVEVRPFQRSSDSIARCRPPRRRCCRCPRSTGNRRRTTLSVLLEAEKPDVLHLHNPYPLLSPWVVKTAHHHGVPVVQTVHNYRQVCSPGLYFRDGHTATSAAARRSAGRPCGTSAIAARAAQSALMATTLAVHRPTWKSVDRFIALTDRIAAHLIDYGIAPDRIAVQAKGLPDPGEPAPLGEGFLYAAPTLPREGP